MYLWEDPRPPFLLLTDLQNGLPTVDGVFGDNLPFPKLPLVRQSCRSRGIPESINQSIQQVVRQNFRLSLSSRSRDPHRLMRMYGLLLLKCQGSHRFLTSDSNPISYCGLLFKICKIGAKMPKT
jgi:hypothetical protein